MTDVLLDTAPLRDQRTMVGVRDLGGAHETIEDVEKAWQEWADKEGLTVRRRANDYTTDLRTSSKTITVYISKGKWIGDCPGCNGGVAGWPFHRRGCCLDCGTIYKLEYPTQAAIEEIVKLFSNRPEVCRDYWPHLGETIQDLRDEQANVELEQPARGAIDLATLKEILSPEAYAELEKAGLAT